MFRLVIYLLELSMWILAKDIGPAHWIGADDFMSTIDHHCHVNLLTDDVRVDCASMSLTTVPKLPKSSTIINLDQNNIANITNLPFLGMENLRAVNLSCNPLRYISQELFKGLWNLQRIYFLECKLFHQVGLDYNYLLSDVRNLGEFALTFNYRYNLCIVIRSSNHLSAIKRASYLTIDATVMLSILASDGNSTSNQTRTKILTLRNDNVGCFIQIFRKRMFYTFIRLESLHIYNRVGEVMLRIYAEADTFSQLDNLISLTISNDVSNSCYETRSALDVNPRNWSIDVFIYNISASVSELKYVRELRMEGFNCPWRQLYLNCSLALSKLARSKSLKLLSLNKNSISLKKCLTFGKNVTYLPESLETLELRENCLGSLDIFSVLALYKQLKYVDARNQNWCHIVNTERKIYDKPTRTVLPVLSKRQPMVFIESDLHEFYFSNCQEPFPYWFERHTNCMFNKLRIMEFTWLKDIRGHSLAIPSDFFKRRPNVRYLDLSGSKINNIDIMAFENISTLEILYLSDNQLAKMGSNLSAVLKELPTLVELHLSNNDITDLNENVFESMNRLTTLDLSRNLLSTLRLSLKHLTNLKLLNISNNKLTTLSQINRNDLDKINLNSPVVVDFTGNLFLCTCDTLAFLKWAMSTKVKFYRKNQFSCTASKGLHISMNRLKHEIATLESACAFNTVLAIACSVGAVVCISCLVSVLVYTFRWRLRYIYYMAKLSVSKSPDAYNRIFDYDAFISYASDDFNIARSGCIEHLENAKEIRLFVHGRDFSPGEAIAYDISVGIHSSKMTIFFLSGAFLSDAWCMYEFNIARMESLYSRRTVVFIVLLESSIVEKLPPDILELVTSREFLEYPEHGDEDDVTVFWNKLADRIQRN